MPAKPKSIATAERKQIRAEIKTLEANRRKVEKDFDHEASRLLVALTKAKDAQRKFLARSAKQIPRVTASIDRRIGLLKGRLGL